MKKLTFRISGLLGLCLLIINLAGTALGDSVWSRPEKIVLSEHFSPFSKSGFKPIPADNESAFDFACRMNTFVHDHTSHFFDDENTFSNIDVVAAPFLWSWPLWLRGFWAALGGKDFVLEFCEAEKGLERGYGFCSQRSLILQDILRRNGLKARTTKLFGHVVCLFWHDGHEIILDPDYGVVIPHSLDEVHNNTDILKKYVDGIALEHLLPIFEAARWRERGDREYDCMSNGQLMAASIVQWGTPALLLGIWLWGAVISFRTREKNRNQ